MTRTFTLSMLAGLLGGTLYGPDAEITGLSIDTRTLKSR